MVAASIRVHFGPRLEVHRRMLSNTKEIWYFDGGALPEIGDIGTGLLFLGTADGESYLCCQHLLNPGNHYIRASLLCRYEVQDGILSNSDMELALLFSTGRILLSRGETFQRFESE